jgi:hypothetical protein
MKGGFVDRLAKLEGRKCEGEGSCAQFVVLSPLGVNNGQTRPDWLRVADVHIPEEWG